MPSVAQGLDDVSSVAQSIWMMCPQLRSVLDDVSSVALGIWMACPQLRRAFGWHVLSCAEHLHGITGSVVSCSLLVFCNFIDFNR